MSIKKSLQIILIISSMIPVIVFSILIHRILTNNIIADNSQTLKRSAEMNMSGLEAMINIQKTEVSLLSLHNNVIEALNNSNKLNAEHAPWSVNTLLFTRKNNYQNNVLFSLYNAKGEVIASSNPNMVGSINNDNITYQYIMKHKSVATGVSGLKPMIVGKDTQYTIEVGSPIVDKSSNRVIGCVISTISTSYFNSVLKTIKIGETGYGMLLSQDGTIIYHPDPTKIGSNMPTLKTSQLVKNYLSDKHINSGSFHQVVDHKNEAFGYSILPDLNLVLVVNQNIKEISSAPL